MTRGSRNLLILGLASILIAVATSGVSLAIYHNSGDIYLDRSRPGFLPDDEEIEEDEQEKEYSLEDTGTFDAKTLDEYLEYLSLEIETLESFENPFGPEVLSDEVLGIPED